MGIAALGYGAYIEADGELSKGKAPKYKVSAITAYLIGVKTWHIEERNIEEELETFRSLDNNKPARIVRGLCMLRKEIMRSWKQLKQSGGNLYSSEYCKDALDMLYREGISISNKKASTLYTTLIQVNNLISDRINNCKSLYPDWINWDYIKELFLMPGGKSEETVKQEMQSYWTSMNMYPYKTYINWKAMDIGNILNNDKKFVTTLYRMHGDSFTDISKLESVSGNVITGIGEFAGKAKKITVLVDCENSDPYKLSAAFKSLSKDITSKVERIILCDDENTGSGWDIFAKYSDMPVERKVIDRIKTDKSLVDMTLCALCCKQFYQSGTESFIIVSSDSDYWALINTLSEASFLVMVEKEKVGPDLKEALALSNIFYCYLDDFYSGGADGSALMKGAVLKEVRNELAQALSLNVYDLLRQSAMVARARPSDEEMESLYQSVVKNLKVTFNEQGRVGLELTQK